MRKTANSEENTAESMLQYDMEETMRNEVKSEKELLLSIVFFFFFLNVHLHSPWHYSMQLHL